MLNSIDVTEEEDDLLEVEDLMRLWKCSRAAISRYMRNDGLPYLKMGKKKNAHLRFRRGAIRQWLAEQEIVEPCKELKPAGVSGTK